MGNSIGLPRTGADIYLSNMGTSVLLIMLVLSGTAIARTEGEKNLVVFLAEHDQTYCGFGVVGFDLNEMPWDRDAFEDQVLFMIRVIDGALARTNWDKVQNFTPRIEEYAPLLENLKSMLSDLRPTDIEINDWVPPAGYVMCDDHPALMYDLGEPPKGSEVVDKRLASAYEIGDYQCIICNWGK
jgi:hypothetical protein